MNLLLLSKSWGQFLGEVARAPQGYVFWLIVFLIVLFILSRLRNRMEERGVNKAIYISRGLVGTFIAFLVTPVVFYVMLNVVALVHGVHTIDVGFLANWIGLTLTSYWWLLKCFFSSSSLVGATELYSVDAIIRVAWVLFPISIIWFRMSKTKMGKLFLIPIILGTLFITRYKHAPPTFITQDEELVSRIPLLNWFAANKDNLLIPNTNTSKGEQTFTPQHRKFLAVGLAIVIFIGFFVGLYLEYRIIGLAISIAGIMGFVLMAPKKIEKIIPKVHQENYNTNLDSLIYKMDSFYIAKGQCIEAYELSQKINATYQARSAMGDSFIFPDTLCDKYKEYFYDWCTE